MAARSLPLVVENRVRVSRQRCMARVQLSRGSACGVGGLSARRAPPACSLGAAPGAAAHCPCFRAPRSQIRFTRIGRKKLPFYRIIAVDSKVRRDGRPLEYLGWYDPLKKEANLNAPAIKKWLGVGAQPSDTVAALLKRAMVRIRRKGACLAACRRGLVRRPPGLLLLAVAG